MHKISHVAMGFISAPALQQYVKCAEYFGVPPEAVLAASGITAAQLADNDNRFPCDTLLRLLDYVLPRCGKQAYGLRTSQFVQPGSYGVLGYITMTSNTLGEALFRISTYESLVGDMGVTDVENEPGLVIARWKYHFQDPAVRRHVVECVLASWVNYARWIMEDGDNHSPVAIRFEHDPPENRQMLQHYQHIFRCPVYFNQPMSAVVLTPAQLERRLRQPDTSLRESLEQHAQRAIDGLRDRYSMVEQVRALMRVMLYDRHPSKELIAEQVGLHIRSLHRRLSEEGESYQNLLDKVRVDVAAEYLAADSMSFEKMAHHLGFVDERSFRRFIRRKTGMTLSQFQKVVSTSGFSLS